MHCIIVLLTEKILKILLISLVVHHCLCPTTDIFRIIFEKLYLFPEFLRMPDIIVILDCDVVSLSLIEEIVESIVRSEVFLTSVEFDSCWFLVFGSVDFAILISFIYDFFHSPFTIHH
jgi:hypothetical protein